VLSAISSRTKLALNLDSSKRYPQTLPFLQLQSWSCRNGLALNPQRAQKVEPTIASFLSSVTILPFSTGEAERAARIRAVLKSQGQPIGAYDVLIAATALHHNLLMVTANQREFVRVPGLQTENWRQT
jgi:tRNA(fMet)-specific endonuclease VapC